MKNAHWSLLEPHFNGQACLKYPLNTPLISYMLQQLQVGNSRLLCKLLWQVGIWRSVLEYVDRPRFSSMSVFSNLGLKSAECKSSTKSQLGNVAMVPVPSGLTAPHGSLKWSHFMARKKTVWIWSLCVLALAHMST